VAQRDWIAEQALFFVGSAPLDGEGHVNGSPKWPIRTFVDVTRVADSCGYGVPPMSYDGQRPHMEAWAEKKLRVGGEAKIEAYDAEKNAASIDGLPAFWVEWCGTVAASDFLPTRVCRKSDALRGRRRLRSPRPQSGASARPPAHRRVPAPRSSSRSSFSIISPARR
jgi:hypothetical protein